MEIKVDAKHDYEAQAKFSRFFVFRGKYYKTKRLLFFTFLFFLTCYVIMRLIEGVTIGYYEPLYLVLMAINLILIAVAVLIYFIRPRIFYKKNGLKDIINTYVFREDKILMTTEHNGVNGSMEIDYAALLKAYETDQYIYLFVSTRQAMLINKKNIDMATLSKLRALLKSKLPPKKYIHCIQLRRLLLQAFFIAVCA